MLQVQVLALALVSSVVLMVSAAPHRADLIYDKDLAHRLLVSFLSELMASRGDEVMLLPELEEQLGVREELIRRHVPFSQRERKAGCRNFFWKTFTSC
ncbi:somatostatin-1A [Sphaeramia orbicularis]|uniref:somatostatin-1A n=1 Tax=Sphaeramia orbicularis TaxID=375764 RepID=UPI00117F12A6|nr:somatostatin-1A-like [Sphaeramia orbicularis]